MTTNTDTTPGHHDANAPGAFARIELPPVPTFGRPPLAYDPMEAMRDEPPTTWQSPFPQPEQARPYTYRVAPPPMAAMPMQAELAMQRQAALVPTLTPVAVPAVAAPVPSRIPPMSPAPVAVDLDASEESDHTVGAPSRVAIVLLVVLAAVLYWASGMAFSAALLAMSALVLVELGRSLAAARADGAPTSSKVVAVLAAVLSVLAALGAVGAMTGEGFVAGLFVLVALAPTLLLVGGVALVLRLKKSATTGDIELRAGIRRLLAATALLAVAGYHANTTFAPTVDSLVAVVIGGFVVVSAVRVLRGSRAA